jgi:DNA-binding IclR family transcriptional regulator
MRSELGYTTHFARRDDDSVVYLASRESRQVAHVIARVGRRLPVHVTALGQAMLAELVADEVAALIPETLPALTEHTLTNRSDLLAEIDRVRSRGYAVEREQGTPGIVCVAAVISYRIPATDAISCSLPAELATDDEIDRVQHALLERTEQLARDLRRAGIR